jgi:putative transposase
MNQIAGKDEIVTNFIQNRKKLFLDNASIAMEPLKLDKEHKSGLADKDKEIDTERSIYNISV